MDFHGGQQQDVALPNARHPCSGKLMMPRSGGSEGFPQCFGTVASRFLDFQVFFLSPVLCKGPWEYFIAREFRKSTVCANIPANIVLRTLSHVHFLPVQQGENQKYC
jgi:hypothetical protein